MKDEKKCYLDLAVIVSVVSRMISKLLHLLLAFIPFFFFLCEYLSSIKFAKVM